jgi:hypothetical protein
MQTIKLQLNVSLKTIMSIVIQPPNIIDTILSALGKQRAVLIPNTNQDQKYGIYVARRESFLRALFRPKGQPPPVGWMYSNLTMPEN